MDVMYTDACKRYASGFLLQKKNSWNLRLLVIHSLRNGKNVPALILKLGFPFIYALCIIC